MSAIPVTPSPGSAASALERHTCRLALGPGGRQNALSRSSSSVPRYPSPFFAMRHMLSTTSPFAVGRLSVTADMLERMFEVVDRLGTRLAGCVNGLDPDRVLGGTRPSCGLRSTGSNGWRPRERRYWRADWLIHTSPTRPAPRQLPRRSPVVVARAWARPATLLKPRPGCATCHRWRRQCGGVTCPGRRPLQLLAPLWPIGAPSSGCWNWASRASLPELREECARVKAAADPDPDATHRRLHRSRRLRRYTDPEGAWTLVAKGTPQAGAVINTALDPIIDEIFRAARRDGRQEPHDAYAFDALLVMANRACGVSVTIEERIEPGDAQGQGSVADTATVDSMLTAPPEPRSEQRIVTGPPRWLNPRYLALLRVDVEALRRGAVSGGELCEITGVGPVPVGRARELLGEAVLKLVITRGVDVCNVTHLGRGPTAAQKVALAWTGPGCAAEGCFRTRIEYDHREDWRKTRHTRLDELDPLCTYHHDLKTRLGWALVSGHGKRALVPPDDSRHPRHPPSMTDQLSDAGESNRQGAGRPHASKLQAGLEQQVALELSGTPPSVP